MLGLFSWRPSTCVLSLIYGFPLLFYASQGKLQKDTLLNDPLVGSSSQFSAPPLGYFVNKLDCWRKCQHSTIFLSEFSRPQSDFPFSKPMVWSQSQRLPHAESWLYVRANVESKKTEGIGCEKGHTELRGSSRLEDSEVKVPSQRLKIYHDVHHLPPRLSHIHPFHWAKDSSLSLVRVCNLSEALTVTVVCVLAIAVLNLLPVSARTTSIISTVPTDPWFSRLLCGRKTAGKALVGWWNHTYDEWL